MFLTTNRVILTEHEYSCESMSIGEVVDTGTYKGTVLIGVKFISKLARAKLTTKAG